MNDLLCFIAYENFRNSQSNAIFSLTWPSSYGCSALKSGSVTINLLMAESRSKVAKFSIQATEMVGKSDEKWCDGKFL
tara:strand:- start:110 stop:343 length:234 start_codon:yes stop_codon:yes gene_type:complete